MNRSAARVTRPKKKKAKLEASWKVYPAHCREIEEDYDGQTIAYLIALRKGKAIWKIVAHSADIIELNRALNELPPAIRKKVLLHYAFVQPDNVVYV